MPCSNKIQRILLINPFQVTSEGYNVDVVRRGGQYAEFPLGLAYLKAAIKQELGLEIEIFDANLEAIKYIRKHGHVDIKELRALLENKIKAAKPDLVGVTCLFHSLYKMAHFACEVVKAVLPNSVVVMGGTYSTVSCKEALSDKNIDIIILSEGERSFVDLIKYLNSGSDIGKIDGIAYKIREKICINPKKKYLENLSSLPWPDRNGFKMDEYTKYTRHYVTRFDDRKKMNILTLTASRGCPFSCIFCSTRTYWGSRIRYRDPDDVLDEVEFLVKEYGATHIIFNDDNFNNNKANTSRILRGIIDRKLKIRWAASSGLSVAGFDRGIIKEMYDSGIAGFNIAIESGSVSMLKKIKKPVLLEKVRSVVKDIRECGNAHITAFFMVGFPFETKEQIQETYAFAKELELDWALFSRVQPYPGTEIHEYCKEHNLFSSTYDLEDLRYIKANIHSENFNEEYLAESAYIANLDLNFVNSRNIRGGDLEQGIRDFKWVIEMVPEHAIAYYCLGRAYLKKHLIKEAEDCFNKAKQITRHDEKWKNYFKHFNIDVENIAYE